MRQQADAVLKKWRPVKQLQTVYNVSAILWLGEPLADRQSGKSHAVVNVQFTHHIGRVSMHGMLADLHRTGDLLLRKPCSDIADNFNLPLG
jgi:hypothetical protein